MSPPSDKNPRHALSPLEAGQAHDLNWRRKLRPRSEEGFFAAWHASDGTVTLEEVYAKSLKISGMGGAPALPPDLTSQHIDTLVLRLKMLRALLRELQIPTQIPDEVSVCVNDWDCFDVLYECDGLLVRCLWYTTA